MHLPVTGHPLHTRSLTMLIRWHESGSWHVRGDIIDLRKSGFAPMTTSLQPAGIIHQMGIDLVVNAENRCLESLEVNMPVVAIEPSSLSGGESCRDPIPRLQQLTGEEIGQGFSRHISQLFGGPKGCSHVLALFHMMAAAIPKALDYENAQRKDGARRADGECVFQRSVMIDGFQTVDKDIEVTVQLGDFYMLPEEQVERSIERLALQQDVRVYTKIRATDLKMLEVKIADRQRCWDNLGEAEWQIRDGWADGFQEASVIPGFAGLAITQCSADPDKQLLLDALLQLAPGYIQIMAALADIWIASVQDESSDSATQPMGGMTDSCYMWRTGGALQPDEQMPEHDLRKRGSQDNEEK